MSKSATNGIVSPYRDNETEYISLREVRRQAALNVALLSELGCSVTIIPFKEFNGYTVQYVILGKETVFSIENVKYAAYESSIDKELMPGFHDMLFNGSTSYILRREGYTLCDSFCKTEIYPYYRRNEIVVCPEGRVLKVDELPLDSMAFYLDSVPDIKPNDQVLQRLLSEF